MTRQWWTYSVILMTLATAALVGRSNTLMLVFALMSGPWIVNSSMCKLVLRRIDVKRTAPARAVAGEPFSVELRVSNGKRWLSSWILHASDPLRGPKDSVVANVLFARIPPRSHCNGVYRACVAQRGLYRFGPLRISTQYPLGLTERSVVINERDDLIVYPAPGRLLPAWYRMNHAARELVHNRSAANGAFDDEFHRMREYRPGDAPRTIHWRTSARQNELMVREMHQNREQDLNVLLDLWLPTAASCEEDRIRIELAIRFVATIVADYCQKARGAKISLFIRGKEDVNWKGTAGPGGIDPMMELLALAEASHGENSLVDFAAESFRSIGSSGRTILITTRERGSKADFAQMVDDIARPMECIEADPERLSRFFQWTPVVGVSP